MLPARFIGQEPGASSAALASDFSAPRLFAELNIQESGTKISNIRMLSSVEALGPPQNQPSWVG